MLSTSGSAMYKHAELMAKLQGIKVSFDSGTQSNDLPS